MKYHNKKAFTLAEVLITLGVIGVVAALTLPSITLKFRKISTENKLKKFYSTINQAISLSISEYGEIEIYDKNNFDQNNSEYVESWMQKYITKNLKTLKAEKMTDRYYEVALIDGSGFHAFMDRPYDSTNMSHLYLFYCLNFNKCNKNIIDGKNTFWFAYDSDRKEILPIYTHMMSISTLKKDFCYNQYNKYGCAALIMKNGWKIPNDYPWIK